MPLVAVALGSLLIGGATGFFAGSKTNNLLLGAGAAAALWFLIVKRGKL